jgi:D-tyrosyl-tRNA(Tyr) deacylase
VIGLIQRVSEASVSVAGEVIARIGPGLLVLVGVQRADGERQADRLLDRLLGYRVFPDQEGRMNRSVTDVAGGMLLVPQFTLAADTRKGMRPSFTPAAPPEEGELLFTYLVGKARARHRQVAQGRFGSEMAIALVNQGPVTFWLEVPPGPPEGQARAQSVTEGGHGQ